MAKCQAWQGLRYDLHRPRQAAAQSVSGGLEWQFARQPCSGDTDNRRLLPDRLQQSSPSLHITI